MVRRLIEQDHVRSREHHAREHAADLLTAGEHLNGFEHILAGEQHPPEEAAQIHVILLFGELAQPVDKRLVVAVEILAVVLGEVAL